MHEGEAHPDSEGAERRHYHEVVKKAVEAQIPNLHGEEKARFIQEAAEGLQELDRANNIRRLNEFESDDEA